MDDISALPAVVVYRDLWIQLVLLTLGSLESLYVGIINVTESTIFKLGLTGEL